VSILKSDIKVYGSANMQDGDTGTQGGAIDKAKKISFEDLSANVNLQIVSSAAGDTSQTVTVTGRDAGGAVISEGKTLSGITPVAMTVNTVWERILKAIKSATTTGDVAVESATTTRSNTATGGGAATASVDPYIDLDAGASASDDFYNGKVIRLTSGTGANQIATIVDYDGTLKRAYVSGDWGTVPDATSVFRISEGVVFDKAPNEVTEVRRAFYAAAAEALGGSAKDYYEKIYFANTHGTLTLTSPQITEAADPSGLIDFGLENSADDTATNRLTAPASVTFNSTAKAISDLAAAADQGVWLHLALAAGEAAQKTTYTPQIDGTTT
jgi:hypothetical protein